MDAKPYLVAIGRVLRDVGLEAVLIGNAAAALQGAPVTTVDFDFLFRKTPRNLRKLKRLATRLHATVLRPYYPMADLYRVMRDDGLQLDFMPTIHGIRSFEGVRDRAQAIEIDGVTRRVASRRCRTSSGARRRPGGRATSPCSRSWRRPVKKRSRRAGRLKALARESERALRDMIRRWQALPPGRRTAFLRRRVGLRGSIH